LAHDADGEDLIGLVVLVPWAYSNVKEVAMLWTIFVILLVLWLLGVVTSYSLGGFIHVLLVIAVILAVMQLIQGRRAL
jgi:Family of unknown function (DUF5670)